MVHFPVALITVGFFFEIVSLFFKQEKCLSRAGFYLLILGALSAIVAWGTGQLFTDKPSEGTILEIFEKHETGGLITMIVVMLAALFRIYLFVMKREETNLKWFAICLYGLAFAAVTYTGFMGGTMVYNYMMAL